MCEETGEKYYITRYVLFDAYDNYFWWTKIINHKSISTKYVISSVLMRYVKENIFACEKTTCNGCNYKKKYEI